MIRGYMHESSGKAGFEYPVAVSRYLIPKTALNLSLGTLAICKAFRQ